MLGGDQHDARRRVDGDAASGPASARCNRRRNGVVDRQKVRPTHRGEEVLTRHREEGSGVKADRVVHVMSLSAGSDGVKRDLW
jgi:hypothetical protein